MAINLKKEAYRDSSEQISDIGGETRPIREVFPTHNDPPYMNGTIGEDGEIYPSREIYPQASVKVSEDNFPAEPMQDDIVPHREEEEMDMTGRFLEPRIYIRKPLKLVLVLTAAAVLAVLISFSLVYNMGQWNFWEARQTVFGIMG